MLLELKKIEKLDGDVFYTIYKDGNAEKSFFIRRGTNVEQKDIQDAHSFFNKLKKGFIEEITILETFNTEENEQILNSTES